MELLKYIQRNFQDTEKIRRHNERVDKDIESFVRQETEKLRKINESVAEHEKKNKKALFIIIAATIVNLIIECIPQSSQEIKLIVGISYVLLINLCVVSRIK